MRLILSVLFAFFFATTLVSGQSTRKILKLAIKETKQNPLPAYFAVVEHKHALVAFPDTLRGYSWYNPEEPSRFLSYNSNFHYYKQDSLQSLINDTAYQSVNDMPGSFLSSENGGVLPSRISAPLEILAEFYVRAKKLERHDSLIGGSKVYILKLTLDDHFEKMVSMNIHNQSETIWIDSATSKIIRYAHVQYWDNSPNYTYCKISYPTQVELEQELARFQMKFQKVPRKISTPNERIDWQVGDTMQITSFRTLQNDSFHLSNSPQDIYLFDFWYTSCFPCVRAIPQNNRLDSVLRQNNSQLLGVTVHHQSDSFLNAFAEKRNINYDLLVVDSENHPPEFPILGYPTYILVNRQGIILYIESGAGEKYDKKLEEDILAIIHAEK